MFYYVFINLVVLARTELQPAQDEAQTNITKEYIPRLIHYIWLGPLPKSNLVRSNIQSWKRYCPGWIIVEWNDDTIESLSNNFAREAYSVGKYAFTADYLRIYIVHKYGGVYLDSDVELRRSIDAFLGHRFFIGLEPNERTLIGPHLFGSEKHHPFLEALLAQFETAHFIVSNNTFNETILPERFNTVAVKLYNFSLQEKRDQPTKLTDGTWVYPHTFFWSHRSSKDGFAYHHMSRTWRAENFEKSKKVIECMQRCKQDDNTMIEQNNNEHPVTRRDSASLSWNRPSINILFLVIIILILSIICLCIYRSRRNLSKHHCFLS